MTGIGLVPAIKANPGDVAFGPQTVGTSSPAALVTISSTGTAALSIDSITVTGASPGDFQLQDSCSYRGHQPGATCTVNVIFTPTATGLRSAVVSIQDNVPGSPHTITLTGIGT
jgi:hypothetical protein